MIIESNAHLRSLRNEAERQGEFYTRRRDFSLADFWNDVATMVTEAIQESKRIRLIIEGRSMDNPSPIKPCEQSEQLPKNPVIKAFQ